MEWEKRNIVGKDRIEELSNLYRELGFEVKVETYDKKDMPDIQCEECFGAPGGEYYVIYTRRKSSNA